MIEKNSYSARPLVSMVAPCFNEELVLPEFYRRAVAACQGAAEEEFEIILVDDGSSDATWECISKLSENDRRVVGVRLFKNYGHQLAATAGLAVSRGDRVMLIDADLQDPPELLSQMMNIMDGGADVVYGKRNTRKGETYFKLATAAMFYRFLNSVSGVVIPPDTGDFRLMRRPVVDILNSMPERHRFIRGMVSWIGGRQVPILYDRDVRFAGTTKYPLRKMIRFAVDGITSFSTVPLRIAVWLGIVSAGLAFAVIVYALVQWMRADAVPGWASAFVSTALFAGVQLFVLGVIGEYLGRLVEQAKHRPLFVIGALRKDGEDRMLPVDFCWLSPSERASALANQADGPGCGSTRADS